MADGALPPLRQEARAEARRIFAWWAQHVPDDTGGFWGEIDADDQPVPEAPKSAVLITRLLWFFSAMARYLPSNEALGLAHRAAANIRDHFLDERQSSIVWLLDHQNQVIDTKRQAYAQAFCIYAIAEYYAATGDEAWLAIARRIQADLDTRFWDHEHEGYIEALTAEGLPPADQRLSDKDMDAPKTMNTHLHVLEGYTRLHAVAPDAQSRAGLKRILRLFADRFVDGENGCLRLFFDMDWTDRTQTRSFGHDIEASWLIWEAAEVLGDAALRERVRPLVLALAASVRAEGINPIGGLVNERDASGHIDPHGEWWGQAEALIGFVNAWQIGGDGAYLDAMAAMWDTLKDRYGAGGDAEWTWYASGAPRPLMVKAGQWKCPYHNGRAMIELDRRLGG